MDITKAPPFVEAEAWLATTERADELVAAWDEWCEAIDGELGEGCENAPGSPRIGRGNAVRSCGTHQ